MPNQLIGDLMECFKTIMQGSNILFFLNVGPKLQNLVKKKYSDPLREAAKKVIF